MRTTRSDNNGRTSDTDAALSGSMIVKESTAIIEELHHFISDEQYPCVAARAAMAQKNIACFVAGHMACPHDDAAILQFIYDFVERFRKSESGFRSAAVIFKYPGDTTPETFDDLLWQRLQALSNLDAKKFQYDERVSPDPSDPDFSFSLGEEAFFLIGLHPGSDRSSRRFGHPAIIFNPHVQFEDLRSLNRYGKLKNIIRRRDVLYSGSINPMLADFKEASEAHQYSGRHYDGEWTCPLKTKHGESGDHSTAK